MSASTSQDQPQSAPTDRSQGRRISPHGNALLKVLSVFAGDETIPEALLLNGREAVELRSYPKSRAEYEEAVETLINDHLVTRQDIKEIHREENEVDLASITISPVIQKAILSRLDDNELAEVYNAALVLVQAVWAPLDASNFYRSRQMISMAKYFPHVDSLRHLGQTNGLVNWRNAIPFVAILFRDAAWYTVYGEGDDILSRGSSFLDLSTKAWSRPHLNHDVSDRISENELLDGIILAHLDNNSALASLDRCLRNITERIQNDRNSDAVNLLAAAHTQYGVAFMRAGKKRTALDEFRHAGTLMSKWYPQAKSFQLPFPFAFPFPWVHRALVLAHDGDLEGAWNEFRHGKFQRSMILGEGSDPIDAGIHHTCHATICALSKEYNTACEELEIAISLQRRILGAQSRWTMTTYYKLAVEKSRSLIEGESIKDQKPNNNPARKRSRMVTLKLKRGKSASERPDASSQRSDAGGLPQAVNLLENCIQF
ncbi:hypothetical protein QBC43DRAFT_308513 [Cladorrhinum sp. PSN259]|nr:hypothetical protein QBC43DRAFT_308513 [Cladorrhinum sp. PSN259]